MKESKTLRPEEVTILHNILKRRFKANMQRHPDLLWQEVLKRLENQVSNLYSLQQMEDSGGEPDVVILDNNTGEFIYCDCSAESPKGRRSLCYDPEALAARKENKPAGSATGMAAAMGIKLLSEKQYFLLQQLGDFDTKTSSWLETPAETRAHGGAIFGDKRYDRVFVYHNGAESYYAARGFRACLQI